MTKTNKEISIKSTKEQILTAYQEALEASRKKPVTPIEEKSIASKTIQVEEVKQYGYDRLNGQLNQIGDDFIKSLDTFRNSINSEYDKFVKLQNAILLEQQHLNDLYEIKENAHTLSAIIIANQKEKEEFDTNMETEEQEWNNRLVELELEYKNKKVELEKQRKREEEEYTYNLNQKRKIETDKYNQERHELLRQLNLQKQDIELREQVLVEKETEFKDLQSKVANIEEETQARIKAAETQLTKSLQQEFKFTQTLNEEQSKRSIELLQQKIESLQEKISEQDNLIAQLNTRLQLAQEQSQQIAHKALETSIQRNVVLSGSTTMNERKSAEAVN